MAPFVSSSVHWEVLAGDKIVARVALYKPRTTWQRLDVLPFAVAYVALHAWTLVGISFYTPKVSRQEGCTSFLTLHLNLFPIDSA